MWLQTTIRHRIAERAIRMVQRGVCSVLRLNSLTSANNLLQIQEQGLFRVAPHKKQECSLAFFHRGSDADLGVIDQIFIAQDYNLSRFPQNRWAQEALRNILESGSRPLIIDAGANIGLASLYFTTKFPSAQIVAVEPSKDNTVLLAKNLAGTNARIHRAAIHSGAPVITLFDPKQGEWGYSTHKSGRRPAATLDTVPCVKFRDLIEANEKPFILKVDIEGGEKGEFNDDEILSQFAVIIVELHDWLYPAEGTSTSFIKFAARADFDFVYRGENVFLFNRSWAVHEKSAA